MYDPTAPFPAVTFQDELFFLILLGWILDIWGGGYKKAAVAFFKEILSCWMLSNGTQGDKRKVKGWINNAMPGRSSANEFALHWSKATTGLVSVISAGY